MRKGRLLLGRRARPPYAGTWDIPGGFLEADEVPEAALRRELREELGIRARPARLVGFAADRYGLRGFPFSQWSTGSGRAGGACAPPTT